ncbi:hypothetical protein [Methylococcus capsulatus]|uniref:hypothetical protein n=1 Tax=Methylococcus capsulatus TaxID=414 RepID=UPI002FD9A7DF
MKKPARGGLGDSLGSVLSCHEPGYLYGLLDGFGWWHRIHFGPFVIAVLPVDQPRNANEKGCAGGQHDGAECHHWPLNDEVRTACGLHHDDDGQREKRCDQERPACSCRRENQ